MTTTVTTYNISTGRISRVIDGDVGTIIANVPDGHGAILGRVDGQSYWIDHSTGEPQPLALMSLVINGTTIGGLPDGATINGLPASEWAPPAGDATQNHVLIEAPRHKPEMLVLKDYRALRAEAYPSASDQLGAFAKIAKAMMDGVAPPADAVAVIAQIDAVKAAHPKP